MSEDIRRRIGRSTSRGWTSISSERAYDYNTGRFLSSDPIGLAGGLNRYVYCDDDPVNCVDPSGLRGIQFGENGPFIGIGDPDFIFTGQGIEQGILTGLNALNSVWFGGDPGCYANEPGFGFSRGAAWTAYAAGWGAAGVGEIQALWKAVGLGYGIYRAEEEYEGIPLVGSKGGSVTPVVNQGYISTPGGDTIPIPAGATGPNSVNSGKGFMYSGGSGGGVLHPNVTAVRVMDPTPAKGPYPEYPYGYVNYMNSGNQAVNPFTGKPISKSDPFWHIPLSPP